jgi:hypothetical protein
MIELNTEVILYRLLRRKEFAEKGVCHGDLRSMKEEALRRLAEKGNGKEVYFQHSSQELVRAVEQYPNHFAWHTDRIVRAPNSQDSYSADSAQLVFDQREVPGPIAKLVLDVLDTFETQG